MTDHGYRNNTFILDNGSFSNPLLYGKFDTDQLAINTKNLPTDTDYVLAVGGKMVAEEVKVTLQTSNAWPDYVFTSAYNLPSLKEVETHINEKGHLKNIPSAAEVEENGIVLGDMNAKLLEKIEELTLYTIAQEKGIEKLSLQTIEQQKEIEELKALVKALIESKK